MCLLCYLITILMTAASVVIFPSLISDTGDLCFLSFFLIFFSVLRVYLRVLLYFFLREAAFGFTSFPCCFLAFNFVDFCSVISIFLLVLELFCYFFLVSLDRNLDYDIRTFLFVIVSLWYGKLPCFPPPPPPGL